MPKSRTSLNMQPSLPNKLGQQRIDKNRLFFSLDTAGIIPTIYPSGKDSAILPDWGANRNEGFESSSPLKELAIK